MLRLSTNQIKGYGNNLNEQGLRQLAIQLLLYPEGKKFIEGCITEFDKFFKFPIGKENVLQLHRKSH